MSSQQSDSIENIISNSKINNKSKFNYKQYLLLLLLFLIVSSDIFSETILQNIPNATEGRDTTFYGAIIAGIILVICHAVISHQIN